MGNKKPNVPADKLELYEKLVAKFPDIDRKGAANPYTSVNGHMFSFMTKEGTLALRLSAEGREKFVKKHKTDPVIQYNTVMKEYVAVPDELLQNTTRLKKDFAASYEYVSSLKPKPTTRPKKKTAKKAAGKKKAPAKKKKPARKKAAGKKTKKN